VAEGKTGGNAEEFVDSSHRRRACGDFEQNFWVEAGAGTGKTSLLIERLYNLAVEKGAPVEKIAAITFTEKAAVELKLRLREKLEQEKNVTGGNRRRRIARALEDLEYAPVGTIHSFAAGLLREKPVEAGIDPQFEVLDGESMYAFFGQAWEEWLGYQLHQESEVLRLLLKQGFSPDRLAPLAYSLYHQRDVVWEGSPSASRFNPRQCRQKLEEKAQQWESYISCCLDDSDKGYRQARNFFFWLNRARHLDEENFTYSLLHLMPVVKAAGNRKNWKPPETCTEQKEISRELQDLQVEMRREAFGYLAGEAVEWLKEFFAYLEEEKAAAGVLDFNDILLQARNLLRDNRETRRYFQSRYDYLMVDEFQDTDPLQAEIVMFLAEKTPAAHWWNRVELSPGKLFIVGDPKQSIYRFRRADIQVYEEVRACLQGQGEELSIVQNFRTVPSVINWVNDAFSQLIKPYPDRSYQPDYTPLHPCRSDFCSRHLTFCHPPEEWKEFNADELRRREARWLASFIKNKVEQQQLRVEEGAPAALGYGDIAVLFPATTGIHYYEEALRELEVPCRLEGGRLFFRRREINDFASLVYSLDNPYHETAVVSTLRHVFGISDDMLLNHVHAGGGFNYLEQEKNMKAEKAPGEISRAFNFLRELRQNRHHFSVSSYLEEILEKSGLLKAAIFQPGGDRAVLNLRKAVDLARSWEKKEPLTVKKFVQWLKDSSLKEKEEPEPGGSETGDSVTLLTVHGSKGLEFPLVVLANFMSGQVRVPPVITDRKSKRFEVYMGAPGFETCGYSQLKEEEKARQEAEKRRLFYVAATRARDYLVLPLTEGKSWGYWKYLSELQELGKIPSGGNLHEDEDMGEDMGEDMEKIEQEYDRLLAEVKENRKRRKNSDGRQKAVSVSQLVELKHKWSEELENTINSASAPPAVLSASTLVDEESPEYTQYTQEYGTEEPRLPGSAGLGSAYHRVMEKISIQPPEEEIAGLVQEAALFWGLEKEEISLLHRLVEATLESTLWERVKKAKIYREVPFSVKCRGVLLEGLIDLLIEEEDGLVVVDYKTDYLSHPEAVEQKMEHYRPQACIYALAVQQVTGRKVKEAAFFLVRLNRLVHLPLTGLQPEGE